MSGLSELRVQLCYSGWRGTRPSSSQGPPRGSKRLIAIFTASGASGTQRPELPSVLHHLTRPHVLAPAGEVPPLCPACYLYPRRAAATTSV